MRERSKRLGYVLLMNTAKLPNIFLFGQSYKSSRKAVPLGMGWEDVRGNGLMKIGTFWEDIRRKTE